MKLLISLVFIYTGYTVCSFEQLFKKAGSGNVIMGCSDPMLCNIRFYQVLYMHFESTAVGMSETM
jgi:hypothetical protein